MKEIKYIKGDELRHLQLVLLDCLLEVDRVCRANDIRYVIGFGTLLGAVRHGGFIPWDDDVDVVMTRENYDKFARVADQLNPQICFFQDNATDKEYPWGYGKVRRTGTTYIRHGQEHLKHRSGMMIDIFPMDDLPQTLTGMRWFYARCVVLRKLTYARVACKSASSALARFGFSLMRLVPIRLVHWLARQMQTKHNDQTPNRAHMMFFEPDGFRIAGNSPTERYGWDKRWLTELTEYEFEGHKLFGPKDYAACLQWSFGPDFMTPPPTADRESHAPCSDYSFGDA